MYKNIESLYCTSETNIKLEISYNFKRDKKKKLDFMVQLVIQFPLYPHV